MLAKHKVGSSTLLTRSTSFLLLSFLREFFSIGFLSFQGEFLTGVDHPIDNRLGDPVSHRIRLGDIGNSCRGSRTQTTGARARRP